MCVTLSLQEGVAIGLEQEIPLIGKSESFFRKMQQEFYSKRDEMAEVLSAAGFKPIVPESGYFMVADTSPLRTYGTHVLLVRMSLGGFSALHEQSCLTNSGFFPMERTAPLQVLSTHMVVHYPTNTALLVVVHLANGKSILYWY